MAIKNDILAALKTRLETLSWITIVEYERIRHASSDYRDHEVPAIQFYDGGESGVHEQGRIRALWLLTLELILKSTSDDSVNMGELYDKTQDIEQIIGGHQGSGRVDLGLASVIHVRYISTVSDVHSQLPYYIAQIDYQVEYYKPYVFDC